MDSVLEEKSSKRGGMKRSRFCRRVQDRTEFHSSAFLPVWLKFAETDLVHLPTAVVGAGTVSEPAAGP